MNTVLCIFTQMLWIISAAPFRRLVLGIPTIPSHIFECMIAVHYLYNLVWSCLNRRSEHERWTRHGCGLRNRSHHHAFPMAYCKREYERLADYWTSHCDRSHCGAIRGRHHQVLSLHHLLPHYLLYSIRSGLWDDYRICSEQIGRLQYCGLWQTEGSGKYRSLITDFGYSIIIKRIIYSDRI